MIETEVDTIGEVCDILQQVCPQSNGKPGLYIGPEQNVPFCLNFSDVLNVDMLTKGAFDFIVVDQELDDTLREKVARWLSAKGKVYNTSRGK